MPRPSAQPFSLISEMADPSSPDPADAADDPPPAGIGGNDGAQDDDGQGDDGNDGAQGEDGGRTNPLGAWQAMRTRQENNRLSEPQERAPTFFKYLLEGETTGVVLRTEKGGNTHIRTELHVGSSTEGLIRVPNAATLRKTLWRSIEENRARERELRNRRNREARDRETSSERDERRERQRASKARYRQRKLETLTSERNSAVQEVQRTPSTKLYKVTHKVDRLTRHTFVHSIHEIDEDVAEGRFFEVTKNDESVTSINPPVEPGSSDDDDENNDGDEPS